MVSKDSASFLDYIDLNEKSLLISFVSITFNPIFWNHVARREYKTKFITRLAGGNAFLGCYALAVTIFSLGIFRDYLYKTAIENQPQYPGLQHDYVKAVAIGLFLAGNIFVLSSMYALGVTGTYLGKEIEQWFASPAGLVLTAWAFFCYIVALRFEGPFTTMIYERRDAAEKAKDN
ncbi:7193_t:CDS:2 [Ambispora gerdemannii]|uniref:Phosphatidyl-N-methylethanolamine N-methyltransferase n=1 Tax=Ambispora gerdemannii TaxID=144530 RepID=A0A9N9F5A8_9GLOM|nr:7193_t:CDS:2 [Ambispora gerdemannii]